jgi:hypothetical protein
VSFSYYYSTVIIMVMSITLTARQYVGQPLQCWVPAECSLIVVDVVNCEFSFKSVGAVRGELLVTSKNWNPYPNHSFLVLSTTHIG